MRTVRASILWLPLNRSSQNRSATRQLRSNLLKITKLRCLVVALLFIFFLTKNSNAQQAAFKNVDEFELLTGAGLTSLRASMWEDKSTKIGYTIGVGAAWSIKEKNSILGRLIVEGKGIRSEYNVTYFDDDLQPLIGEAEDILNLTYITIPLSYRIRFGKSLKFNVESGLYASYLIKAQLIQKTSWQGKEIYNEKDNLNKFDSGITVRAAYQKSLHKNLALSFWIQGNYGLVEIGKSTAAPGIQKAKNQVLVIGLSILKIGI